MPVIIRAAEAADQHAIRQLVYTAHLNPIGLDWPNFLVAEDMAPGRRILAGVGQLRPHADGSRELASLAVAPAYQDLGIGRALVRTLISQGPRPLYLFCRCEQAAYYAPFGFRTVSASGLPPVLASQYRIGQVITGIARLLHLPACLTAMAIDNEGHPG